MTLSDSQSVGFAAVCLRREVRRAAVVFSALVLAVAGGAGAPLFGQLPNPLREAPPLIELQTKLAALGDFHGKPDGMPSTETARAIRRFQIRSGLPVTGEADAETWRRIRLEVEQGVRDGALPPEAAGPSSESAAPPRGAANGPGGAPAQPFFSDTPADAAAARGPGGAEPEGPGAALRYSRFAASPEPVQRAVLADATAALAARRLLVLSDGEEAPWLSPAFAAALREFQAAEGLTRSGVLDDPTLERLGLIAPEPAESSGRREPERRRWLRLPWSN